MPLNGFYYTYGDDTEMIEKRWLPDVKSKYPGADWIRLDTTIDEINIGSLTTEYYANSLFSKGKVIVIRNVDNQLEKVYDLTEILTNNPIKGNVLILVAKTWNKTTKLGKLVKKHFIAKEFVIPEVKPFDLLDHLNTKNTAKVLFHSNRLFETGYNPLALFSLVFSHFLLLRQIRTYKNEPAEIIARNLKQHVFRVKKGMVANRYWSLAELDEALQKLSRLDELLRSWQYDEKMLLQMYLINITL